LVLKSSAVMAASSAMSWSLVPAVRMASENHRGGGPVGACGEDVGSGGGHAGEDFGGLLGRFALGVDDFGEAGAEASVMIDAGVAEVFVREGGEALGGGGGCEGAGLYCGEKF
jgi:hypothetical protein